MIIVNPYITAVKNRIDKVLDLINNKNICESDREYLVRKIKTNIIDLELNNKEINSYLDLIAKIIVLTALDRSKKSKKPN